MLSALAFSFAALALQRAGLLDLDDMRRVVSSIDFGDLVLHGLLAFLLFAGALHVDLRRLRTEAWTVGLLATIGVAISAGVMGLAFWGAARALGLELPLAFALLFGVLIAPTDPIAVLAILRQAGAPPALEMQITGESLLNDGVAVVLFITLLGFATAGGAPPATDVVVFFAREVGGALLLGGGVGFVAYHLLHGIDEYPVELLITLAAAMGGYSAAETLGASAPITVVVAGLLIGNPGRAHAMSERTRAHVDSFWELVDYAVNAVLFVLLGLEVVLLVPDLASGASAWLIAAAVPLSVAARFAGVALPIALLGTRRAFGSGTIAMLTWGGLKGGISLALALSLPAFAGRELVLGATYAVVVFSMLAQGLTVGRLARAVCRRDAA